MDKTSTKSTRKRPWYVDQRWSVEALTPAGWHEIYCTGTKAQAAQDAAAWTRSMGQQTRIVPGPGHRLRRENPFVDVTLRHPEKLSEDGLRAWNAILGQVRRYDLKTGGCRAFYAPEEWAKRGERYGANSVLVVVYDGSELGYLFSLDRAAELSYSTHEAMCQALDAVGFYAEECTGWYSAIYPK